MAKIKFIREYKPYKSDSTWYDIYYAGSCRLVSYPAEDMPKTAKKWLEDKEGETQYNRTLGREEVIYKAETVYKVEFDFRVNGKVVHDYLDNNGKGFSKEDAVAVGKQLVAQGNMHVMMLAI